MIDPQMLQKRWIHSHEEDTDTEMVFRPAGYNFPPARGRDEYELLADGGLSTTSPGPTDRREAASGSWQLQDGKTLVLNLANGVTKQLPIASVTPERLVVTK